MATVYLVWFTVLAVPIADWLALLLKRARRWVLQQDGMLTTDFLKRSRIKKTPCNINASWAMVSIQFCISEYAIVQ